MKGSTLTSWVLCAWALLGGTAHAEGELVFDYFYARAETVEDAADPDSGRTTLDAGDLGIRFLYAAPISGLGEGAQLQIDYHGREALQGDARNSDLRLVYAANVTWPLSESTRLSVGRFLAPSVVLLPVDGVQLTRQHRFRDGEGTATIFAGRRGVLTSRRNVPFDEFLPAVGADWQWRNQRFSLGGTLGYSEDEAILVNASQELKRPYGSFSGAVQASAVLSDSVTAYFRLAGFEQASVRLGPSWTELDLDVEALDLWHATGFVRWRPNRNWRFRYGLHSQRAAVQRVGVQLPDGSGGLEQVSDPGFRPKFTDHRLRAERRFMLGSTQGWIRARVRYRERPDRSEFRFGGELHANNLLWEGVTLRASAFYDEISGRNGRPVELDGDRRHVSAAIGFRRDGWHIEAGGHWLDRDAPYSGRTFTLADPGEPDDARDHSLFVLEAQTNGFVRAFWTGRKYFAGLDLERNLEDGGEFRAFAQLGIRFGEGR